VPVGATTAGAAGPIEAGDVTASTEGVDTATFGVDHPATALGDLLVFHIGHDNSAGITALTAPAGQDSETLSVLSAFSSANGVGMASWYVKCTAAWTSGTLNFTTTGGSERMDAAVVHVLAGEFDATTPIGTVATSSGNGSAVNSPAITAGSTDGGGLLLHWAVVDADPFTSGTSAGWTELFTEELGPQTVGLAVKDATVTDSQVISAASNSWSIATDGWQSTAYIIRPSADVTNELYIFDSAVGIANDSTASERLTADGSGIFFAGKYYDTTNGAALNITDGNFTELVWNLKTQSPAADNNYWEFKVAGMTNYDFTPKVTLDTGGGGGPTPSPFGGHNIDRQYATIAAHRLGGVLQ